MTFSFKFLSVFVILLFPAFVFAQTAITGRVVGQDGGPIDGANVLLKDSKNKTVSFSSTAFDGTFTLKAMPGSYHLRVTYLGFKTVNQDISVAPEKLYLEPIVIQEDSSELEEVFLKAEAKIEERGDTTIFKTAKFLLGTEQSLNDILQTLPGMGVNDV